ncbi:insulin-like growth factor binding protein [Anaeramoeba flamelloides]|uniref:Insulin-like growth factor binding protein n=1 Tax=Anaeramoeba flamelloides TaxID=1746091 RepID=A0AAV7ZT44_9EUKA|nr:insulin-like growth factor binding proteinn-terminal [Anaeramoeba flamelloides]KAJ6252518.1 insulin-like growth factor binding protein [Anaeramoeba flamelloides]
MRFVFTNPISVITIFVFLFTTCRCCKVCPAGTISNSVNCSFCPAGFCPDTKECVPCHDGYYSSSNRSVCIPCGPGFENNFDKSCCIECQLGFYNNKLGSLCKSCSKGTYAYEIGMTSCVNCPFGAYQSLMSQSKCINCGKGKYTKSEKSTSVAQCLDCPAGTYCDQDRTENPKICPENYKCSSRCTTPVKCAVLTKSKKGQDSCTVSSEFYLVLFGVIAFIILATISGILTKRRNDRINKQKINRPELIEYNSDLSSLQEKDQLVPKPKPKENVYSGF